MQATLRKCSPRIVVQDAWQVSRHVGRGMFTALAELGIARATPPKTLTDAVARQSLAAKAMAVAADLITVVEGEFPRAPCLLAANYVCDLDPIVLLAQTPALPVVRRDAGEQLVLGSVARALEVVFVDEDRTSRVRALRRIDAALRSGVSVLNFPEGTPSPTSMPRQFARGSFGIAQRLGVPVVPIAIHYDTAPAWPTAESFWSHYLRVSRHRQTAVRIVIGNPLFAERHDDPSVLAGRARSSIARMLERAHSIANRPRLGTGTTPPNFAR